MLDAIRHTPPLDAMPQRIGRDLPPRRCHTCRRATNGRKPYCERHIADMPYVASLLEKLGTSIQDETDDDSEEESAVA